MKKKALLFTVLTALLMILMGCVTVSAAQKSNIALKPNVTYTRYDVTGDGKSDKIRINFKSGKQLSIDVNGKQRYKISTKYIWKINTNLLSFKGNRQFLKLKCQDFANDHISYDKLLCYKSGKIRVIGNLMSHRKSAYNMRHNSYIQKVGGDYVQFRMQSMPGGVGSIQYTVTYKLTDGALKLSGSTYPVTYKKCYNILLYGTNFWTTSSRLNMYSAVGGGKKMYTTGLYEACTVNKICFKNNHAYIYITAEDEDISGWVKCPNSYTKKFFEQTLFV